MLSTLKFKEKEVILHYQISFKIHLLLMLLLLFIEERIKLFRFSYFFYK